MSALLGKHELVAGQVLLTPYDFFHRSQYLHARVTLQHLLDLGVLPIVNENDTVADDEIRYGDNDRLAALVSHMLGADLLLMLTDTAGVFTADPRHDQEASLIEEIVEIDAALEQVVGGAGTERGSGGMASKLAAAKIAAWSGVRTVIASAALPGVVADAVAGRPVGTSFAPRRQRLREPQAVDRVRARVGGEDRRRRGRAARAGRGRQVAAARRCARGRRRLRRRRHRRDRRRAGRGVREGPVPLHVGVAAHLPRPPHRRPARGPPARGRPPRRPRRAALSRERPCQHLAIRNNLRLSLDVLATSVHSGTAADRRRGSCSRRCGAVEELVGARRRRPRWRRALSAPSLAEASTRAAKLCETNGRGRGAGAGVWCAG